MLCRSFISFVGHATPGFNTASIKLIRSITGRVGFAVNAETCEEGGRVVCLSCRWRGRAAISRSHSAASVFK